MTMRLQNTAVFNCYVLGPLPRFFHSQILCRLYKSPSDKIIKQGPLCVYACKKDHILMLKIQQSMSEFDGL